MQTILANLRVAGVTILVCVIGYAAVILGVAQVFSPYTANGSLIERADGTIVGSRRIAQGFTQPGYFWPRPSAVGYNASGAGGSNKASTSPDLTARAVELIALYGATPEKPLPPELAAASGGGLDPHVSEHAALYQAERVSQARGLPLEEVQALVHEHAATPSALLSPDRRVNVLELNLALDAIPSPR